jgi:hypothetical protein
VTLSVLCSRRKKLKGGKSRAHLSGSNSFTKDNQCGITCCVFHAGMLQDSPLRTEASLRHAQASQQAGYHRGARQGDDQLQPEVDLSLGTWAEFGMHVRVVLVRREVSISV